MSFFDSAMQMEKDGEAFYRELAAKHDGGIAAIFGRLADAEVTHQVVLQKMKADEPGDFDETAVSEECRNIFQTMREEGTSPRVAPNATDPFVDLYRQALDIEKASVTFYEEKAGAASDALHKSVLGKLAEEEKRHCWVLSNIIESVGRPDFGWIEFAEWRHAEEY